MDILNVGRMNMNGQQKAVGIGDDMPLAPMDALAGVEAARPAGLRRRCTLAVDDGSRRPAAFARVLRRACRTKASTILCHLPVSRQA